VLVALMALGAVAAAPIFLIAAFLLRGVWLGPGEWLVLIAGSAAHIAIRVGGRRSAIGLERRRVKAAKAGSGRR
jgi:hypothetical protein